MNHFNSRSQLTDQLERRLIQQEINQQMAFSPVFNLKGAFDKLASLLGYVRVENTLGHSRTAEA